MKVHIPMALFLGLFCFSTTAKDEIGFIETFSLSDDREEALKQLIPGTEDYYYYHCLHFQNTGNRSEYEKYLKRWIDRPRVISRVMLSERRDAEQTRRRLEAQAAQWERLGSSEGGLMDEFELLEAEHWLSGPDAEELGASNTLRDLVGKSREAQEGQAAQKRRNARFRLGAAGAIGVLVIVVLIAIIVGQNQLSRQERESFATAEALVTAEARAHATTEAEAIARQMAEATAQAEAKESRHQSQISLSQHLLKLATQTNNDI